VVSALHERLRRFMQIEGRTSRTVLVVDDDADMRKLLRDFLQPGGYDVLEAANGHDAMVLVDSEPIDVVVLDKEMPGLNGLDVLSLLQRRRPGLPVIFVTAFGGPQIAEESRRRGATEYLEKPFRVRRIVDTIDEVVQRAH
jgi:two-component system, OmpR family, response regulator